MGFNPEQEQREWEDLSEQERAAKLLAAMSGQHKKPWTICATDGANWIRGGVAYYTREDAEAYAKHQTQQSVQRFLNDLGQGGDPVDFWKRCLRWWVEPTSAEWGSSYDQGSIFAFDLLTFEQLSQRDRDRMQASSDERVALIKSGLTYEQALAQMNAKRATEKAAAVHPQ